MLTPPHSFLSQKSDVHSVRDFQFDSVSGADGQTHLVTLSNVVGISPTMQDFRCILHFSTGHSLAVNGSVTEWESRVTKHIPVPIPKQPEVAHTQAPQTTVSGQASSIQQTATMQPKEKRRK